MGIATVGDRNGGAAVGIMSYTEAILDAIINYLVLGVGYGMPHSDALGFISFAQ